MGQLHSARQGHNAQIRDTRERPAPRTHSFCATPHHGSVNVLSARYVLDRVRDFTGSSACSRQCRKAFQQGRDAMRDPNRSWVPSRVCQVSVEVSR